MNLQPCSLKSERFRQRTVLLVEDEPFVREATRSILESAGFEVLPAGDAVDAMNIYGRCDHCIDLVMTDMVLPGCSGQQLGQELQQRSPELKVLVTSGYTNAEYAIEEPASHTYFLAKPYSMRGLVEKIEQILGTMPLQRAASQAS
jgi:two-component system, cell cycle sensor histidine kinase and response regulator CckA